MNYYFKLSSLLACKDLCKVFLFSDKNGNFTSMY